MRPSHITQAALLLAATCLSWNATGATWRCGNAYTDQPCNGGRPLGIDADRETSQRNADDATRDARATADRMEAQRQRLEAMGARNRPIVIDNAPRRAAEERPAAKLRMRRKEALYTKPNAAPKKKSKKKSGP